jgi:hypothetical protein
MASEERRSSLCCALLRSASQASPTRRRMAGAEAGVSTADLVDFTVADLVAFTLARFTAVDFTPGAFHGGGFHGGFAGLHNSYGNGAHWYHGWRNGRYGWWWGNPLGWTYYPYPYGWDNYPDYGYYDYSQPNATQTWYYCSDPAGYYPYVTQCNTAWQPVPAS